MISSSPSYSPNSPTNRQRKAFPSKYEQDVELRNKLRIEMKNLAKETIKHEFEKLTLKSPQNLPYLFNNTKNNNENFLIANDSIFDSNSSRNSSPNSTLRDSFKGDHYGLKGISEFHKNEPQRDVARVQDFFVLNSNPLSTSNSLIFNETNENSQLNFGNSSVYGTSNLNTSSTEELSLLDQANRYIELQSLFQLPTNNYNELVLSDKSFIENQIWSKENYTKLNEKKKLIKLNKLKLNSSINEHKTRLEKGRQKKQLLSAASTGNTNYLAGSLTSCSSPYEVRQPLTNKPSLSSPRLKMKNKSSSSTSSPRQSPQKTSVSSAPSDLESNNRKRYKNTNQEETDGKESNEGNNEIKDGEDKLEGDEEKGEYTKSCVSISIQTDDIVEEQPETLTLETFKEKVGSLNSEIHTLLKQAVEEQLNLESKNLKFTNRIKKQYQEKHEGPLLNRLEAIVSNRLTEIKNELDQLNQFKNNLELKNQEELLLLKEKEDKLKEENEKFIFNTFNELLESSSSNISSIGSTHSDENITCNNNNNNNNNNNFLNNDDKENLKNTIENLLKNYITKNSSSINNSINIVPSNNTNFHLNDNENDIFSSPIPINKKKNKFLDDTPHQISSINTTALNEQFPNFTFQDPSATPSNPNHSSLNHNPSSHPHQIHHPSSSSSISTNVYHPPNSSSSSSSRSNNKKYGSEIGDNTHLKTLVEENENNKDDNVDVTALLEETSQEELNYRNLIVNLLNLSEIKTGIKRELREWEQIFKHRYRRDPTLADKATINDKFIAYKMISKQVQEIKDLVKESENKLKDLKEKITMSTNHQY